MRSFFKCAEPNADEDLPDDKGTPWTQQADSTCSIRKVFQAVNHKEDLMSLGSFHVPDSSAPQLEAAFSVVLRVVSPSIILNMDPDAHAELSPRLLALSTSDMVGAASGPMLGVGGVAANAEDVAAAIDDILEWGRTVMRQRQQKLMPQGNSMLSMLRQKQLEKTTRLPPWVLLEPRVSNAKARSLLRLGKGAESDVKVLQKFLARDWHLAQSVLNQAMEMMSATSWGGSAPRTEDGAVSPAMSQTAAQAADDSLRSERRSTKQKKGVPPLQCSSCYIIDSESGNLLPSVVIEPKDPPAPLPPPRGITTQDREESITFLPHPHPAPDLACHCPSESSVGSRSSEGGTPQASSGSKVSIRNTAPARMKTLNELAPFVLDESSSSFGEGPWEEQRVPTSPFARMAGNCPDLLRRGTNILDSIPVMATLMNKDWSSIIYQNTASTEFWRDALGVNVEPSELLNVLFKDQTNLLTEMQTQVVEGCQWRGVLRVEVPTSLLSDLGGALDENGSPSSMGQSSASRANFRQEQQRALSCVMEGSQEDEFPAPSAASDSVPVSVASASYLRNTVPLSGIARTSEKGSGTIDAAHQNRQDPSTMSFLSQHRAQSSESSNRIDPENLEENLTGHSDPLDSFQAFSNILFDRLGLEAKERPLDDAGDDPEWVERVERSTMSVVDPNRTSRSGRSSRSSRSSLSPFIRTPNSNQGINASSMAAAGLAVLPNNKVLNLMAARDRGMKQKGSGLDGGQSATDASGIQRRASFQRMGHPSAALLKRDMSESSEGGGRRTMSTLGSRKVKQTPSIQPNRGRPSIDQAAKSDHTGFIQRSLSLGIPNNEYNPNNQEVLEEMYQSQNANVRPSQANDAQSKPMSAQAIHRGQHDGGGSQLSLSPQPSSQPVYDNGHGQAGQGQGGRNERDPGGQKRTWDEKAEKAESEVKAEKAESEVKAEKAEKAESSWIRALPLPFKPSLAIRVTENKPEPELTSAPRSPTVRSPSTPTTPVSSLSPRSGGVKMVANTLRSPPSKRGLLAAVAEALPQAYENVFGVGAAGRLRSSSMSPCPSKRGGLGAKGRQGSGLAPALPDLDIGADGETETAEGMWLPKDQDRGPPAETTEELSEFDTALTDEEGVSEIGFYLDYHEVHVIPIIDPVTGDQAMLLLQTDITNRAELERRMAALTEAQLSMLENMFPRHVLEYMVTANEPSNDLSALARSHSEVTVLFMDIVGFTSMSKEVSSQAVMGYLNELFTLLDNLVDQHKVYKVDTAGDCYIVAGGLMAEEEDGVLSLDHKLDPQIGAQRIFAFTKALMMSVQAVAYPHTGLPTSVRVGVHTGSCVSGLIGTKMPKFSLWGDTMNTASRMESTSQPGCVQVSETTFSLLGEEQQQMFTPTGGVKVKGKGVMQTYLLAGSTIQYEDVPTYSADSASSTNPASCIIASSPAASNDPPSRPLSARAPIMSGAMSIHDLTHEAGNSDQGWKGVAKAVLEIKNVSLNRQKTSPATASEALAIQNDGKDPRSKSVTHVDSLSPRLSNITTGWDSLRGDSVTVPLDHHSHSAQLMESALRLPKWEAHKKARRRINAQLLGPEGVSTSDGNPMQRSSVESLDSSKLKAARMSSLQTQDVPTIDTLSKADEGSEAGSAVSGPVVRHAWLSQGRFAARNFSSKATVLDQQNKQPQRSKSIADGWDSGSTTPKPEYVRGAAASANETRGNNPAADFCLKPISANASVFSNGLANASVFSNHSNGMSEDDRLDCTRLSPALSGPGSTVLSSPRGSAGGSRPLSGGLPTPTRLDRTSNSATPKSNSNKTSLIAITSMMGQLHQSQLHPRNDSL